MTITKPANKIISDIDAGAEDEDYFILVSQS